MALPYKGVYFLGYCSLDLLRHALCFCQELGHTAHYHLDNEAFTVKGGMTLVPPREVLLYLNEDRFPGGCLFYFIAHSCT
jgi:hypothetical protein